MIFTLPHMVWGQPPYWVHRMLHEQWQDSVLKHDVNGVCGAVLPVANASQVGSQFKILYTNYGAEPSALKVHLPPELPRPTSVDAVVLAWPDTGAANTPSQPNKIVPQATSLPYDVASSSVTVPALSFSVLTFR
jgi:hypothetical protein